MEIETKKIIIIILVKIIVEQIKSFNSTSDFGVDILYAAPGETRVIIVKCR